MKTLPPPFLARVTEEDFEVEEIGDEEDVRPGEPYGPFIFFAH